MNKKVLDFLELMSHVNSGDSNSVPDSKEPGTH